MDDEAIALRRAQQLDEQADDLLAAAAELRDLAGEVTGPVQRVGQGLRPEVWEGNAATQAAEALAERTSKSRALADRLDGLAEHAQRTAQQLRDEADGLRRQLAG